MQNNLPDIDFSNIRLLDNSKNKGFEELTVQIFRSSFSSPSSTIFYRVDDAGGDGGVEDIAFNKNSKKTGLQAKYFKTLGQTQWTQINKSVRTAIKTHAPELIEYRIATPVNRKKDSKTWNRYIKKWQNFAKSKYGYTEDIKFVWLGETELREELTQEKHKSRLLYWFGLPYYSIDLLKQQLKTCEEMLETRYTPEHHIKTSVELKLDAFFLRNNFIKTLNNKVIQYNSSISDLLSREAEINSELLHDIRKVSLDFQNLFLDEINLPDFDKLTELLKIQRVTLSNVYDFIIETQKNDNNEEQENTPFSNTKSLDYELTIVRTSLKQINSVWEFLINYKVFDNQFVLLQGEAGTGKSHLLASITNQSLDRKQPCLMFVGEQFTTSAVLTEQMQKCFNWENDFTTLLHALSTEAEILGKPSIIVIDALNESHNKKIWKSHLLSLQNILKEFPRIKLIVSCRTDFLQYVVPESISKKENNDWETIYHDGFEFEIHDAVEKYFNGYNIRSRHFPTLIEEFKNPLFLKTFCEAYQGREIPEGTLSFSSVMEAKISYFQSIILDSIDCPKYKTKKAIELTADAIQSNNGNPVPHEEIRPKIDDIFSGSGDSNSLYVHLLSNGIIYEIMGENEEILVRFPYERFSDYYIVSKILEPFVDLKQLQSEWKQDNLPNGWVTDWQKKWHNRGLLKMFAILVPEKFNCEFIKLFHTNNRDKFLYIDFMESLLWRSNESISIVTHAIYKKCFRLFGTEQFIGFAVRLMIIPNHPFNASLLNNTLMNMSLAERDSMWTIPVTNLTSHENRNAVTNIIHWALNVSSDLVSEEQAELVSIFLTWLLSSNYRLLRFGASLALTKILIGRSKLAIKLIEEFHDCNDPYIVERIYATTLGSILRENNVNSIQEVCSIVYAKVFAPEFVTTNIMIRVYARLILEYAKFKGAKIEICNDNNYSAPFNSKWPEILPQQTINDLDNSNDWRIIVASLQPESSGYYGDFGRYTMEAYTRHFSNQKLINKYIDVDKYENMYSGLETKNYILTKIEQLGWDPELFKDFDEQHNYGRMRVDQEEIKIERIGKKYQWISLHEFLGSLCDHYWMLPDSFNGSEPKICHNARDIQNLDFDPSQPLLDPLNNYQFDLTNEELFSEELDIPWSDFEKQFSDLELLNNKEKWVSTSPTDFSKLIFSKSIKGYSGSWLTLSGHFNWTEQLNIRKGYKSEGQLKIWTDLRCWLIKKTDKANFLKYIENMQFHGKGLDNPSFYDLCLGEYPWSNNSKEYDFVITPNWLNNPSFQVSQVACEYENEKSSISARIPSPVLFDILKISWSGKDFEYIDADNNLIAFCYNKTNINPVLYIKKKEFLEAVDKAGYIPLWAILCEKSCYNSKLHKSEVKKWGITQNIYCFENEVLEECHNLKYDRPLYN